uniref:Sorting nexin-2 n=1 Tax=Esox lucius TaxID=8010 RepID=A0A6Q2Y9F6_ESOLU
MATSSERSPPPFPDSEDQELEPEEVRDQDSDDGGDIFLGAVSICLEAFSSPVMDVFGELPRNLSSAPVMDILTEPASKTSTAPMEDSISKPSSTSVVDILCEPSSDNVKEPEPDIIDPLADMINNAPVRDARAPIAAVTKEPTRDLFDDEPSDLFAEPRPSKTIKQPQTSTDIFGEEAVTTVPSAVKRTIPINSKTNGVHSDEEADIFAEATVELSLDSPRNDRKRKEAAKPTASAPSVTASVSKPQPPTLEEREQKCEGDLTKPVNVFHSTGDGMNAYMAYKVSTQTTLPMFRSKMFTVRRRFSDFLGLYEKLLDKHAQSGYIVPPPPEKSIMGMTKVKVGKEDNSSAEFVEKRRAALERYLQRVVCHPSLLQDPDVREFLERDDMPRAHSTQALSGAGFLKMINRATDAVSKMTIKMNESDVWFEDKLLEVEAEDQQLRKLHIMVESLVGHRKELSVNTAGFAKSVAMLGSSEDNTALSRALSQLAEVEDKMEQLHQDQAASDSFCLAELLADYIRLLGSVRASFDQRMKTWQRWQDAQNMLQKKRETEAKLLWANKPDKLQQAKDEITEWEAKVTQYEKDFDRVSSTVRKEVLRFEKEKARDFKKQIIKYLESLLQSQQQVEFWTLPQAKTGPVLA